MTTPAQPPVPTRDDEAAAVAARLDAASPKVNDRLCHLFRASLKNGRIHPLYLPILKYRHSRVGA